MARAEPDCRRGSMVPRSDSVGRLRNDPRFRDRRPRAALLHDRVGPPAVLQGRARGVFRRDIIRANATGLITRPAEEDALLLEPGRECIAELLELLLHLSGAEVAAGPPSVRFHESQDAAGRIWGELEVDAVVLRYPSQHQARATAAVFVFPLRWPVLVD